MKEIVFDPIMPTNWNVVEILSTAMATAVVANKMIGVSIRLWKRSLSGVISLPRVTNTIIDFLQGNNCNGKAQTSAIANSSFPICTATFALGKFLMQLPSTLTPYVAYGSMSAGKKSSMPVISDKAATRSSLR